MIIKKNEIKELESELNEKDKNIDILKSNIKNLENKNSTIVAKSNKYFEEMDKLKKINNTNNQKIQELEKILKENEKYLNDHEENRIETEKKIQRKKRNNKRIR